MVRKYLLLLALASPFVLLTGCTSSCDRPSLFTRLFGPREEPCCEMGCCSSSCCEGPSLGGYGGGPMMTAPQAPMPPLTPTPRLVPQPQAQPMPAIPSSAIR
jgi:hypothetical protein